MISRQIRPSNASADRSRKTLTPQVSLLIADEIREEQSGKLLAVGLYTDRILLADPLPGGVKPTPDAPVVLSSLCFVLTITGVTGRVPIEVSYSDPTLPKFVGKVERIIESDSTESAVNIMGKFAPFPFGGFGTKILNVRIGDVVHAMEFKVLERDEAPPKVRFVESLESERKPARGSRKLTK